MQRALPATVALAALGLFGCREELAGEGQFLITTGAEADTWTRNPAAVTARVDKVTSAGRSEHVVLDVASETFGMGMGDIGSYELFGEDEDGVVRVRGRTLLVDPAGFADSYLPLFVGRTDRFCRPPAELVLDHGAAPPVAVIGGRSILIAGHERDDGWIDTEYYDLGYWEQAPGPALDCGETKCRPQTLVTLGAVALGLGEGWATWFDFDSAVAGTLEPPADFDFDDVAGGRGLEDTDGNVWIVGATRAEPPTAWVMRIDAADGSVSTFATAELRAGAAAAWVEGRGLVVAGGSATGTGAEILRKGEESFESLGLPSDATHGAALVALDTKKLLRLGGEDAAGAAASVELDLGCVEGCEPEPAGDVVPVIAASGFAAGDLGTLVVGEDTDGQTRAYVFSEGVSKELSLRVPRRGAVALALPTGQIAVVGGEDLDGHLAGAVELLTP